MTFSPEALADHLEDLWKAGVQIDALPDALQPRSEAEALATQKAYVARHPSCGWKVGPTGDGKGWSAAPLRGPALPSGHRMQRFPGLRIEVEVALILQAPLAAGADPVAARAAIGEAVMSVELLGSRFRDPSQQPAAVPLADNLSNAGVLIGSGVDFASLPPLGNLPALWFRNGEQLGSSRDWLDADRTLEALCWLAGHAAELGKPLKAGDVVMTGARIGPLNLSEDGDYLAESAIGELRLEVGA